MKRVILLSVSILLICLAYSFAEVPCKINYQGRLIKDNVPVDGTRTMKFSIYDSAVGPTLLWTSGNVSVEVHNGLFRYVIGSGGTDLSSIDWTAGQTLYLEVIVEGQTLTPREELSAYPYAINSHLLEGEAKEYFLNTSGDTQTKQGNLNIMGNLGIGTTGPATLLELGKSGGGAIMRFDYPGFYAMRMGIPAGQTYFAFGESDDLASGVKMVIEKTSGNVGIGTASPGEKLTVAGTIESTTGGVKFPDGTVQTTATGSFIPADINTIGWGNDSAGSVEFPNGLIMKWGIQGISAPITVTFSTPFPHACFQVIGVQANSSDYHTNIRIDTITRTSFNSYVKPTRWFAIGR